MRLDKYLASTTQLSRKQAGMQIRRGAVRVHGQRITDASYHLDSDSPVEFAGQRLRLAGFRYFMLHKPRGVVCATRDAHHTTVIDLLDLERATKLQIAGRLDKDTSGLVLLTDDGQWNHRLTSPRHHCAKVYELTTLRPIEDAVVGVFAQGIVLMPENKRTQPAQLLLHERCSARLTLYEGRYHQVKRMFEATGNRVLCLHRSAIGRITLDQQLRPGAYRPLNDAEIACPQA